MTQDVFLRAYRGLSRFRDQAPPRAWLAAIADNAIKNRYRSRSRFRRIFAPDPSPEFLADRDSGAASPEENARVRESRESVLGALQKLPLDFRLPVVLRDLEEWSYEEIAASLELPIGTVKSRIARGRGQLRAILAPLLTSEKNP
jgi:RNA polymerase sigma-70 factor (ECF subfamily)